MASTLQIPDQFYQEAAEIISGYQLMGDQISDPARFDASRVEKILRAYVYLGVNKKIVDYLSTLDVEMKNQITQAVSDRVTKTWSTRPLNSTTASVLRTSEALVSKGLVNPNITYPRSAQERYEKDVQNAPKLPDPIAQGIENFFSVVKGAIEPALKGLGINIPVEMILLIVGGLVILNLTGGLRRA